MDDRPTKSLFLQLVPQRYWRRTGLDRYEFAIIDPRPFIITHRRAEDGSAHPVPPSLLYSQRTEKTVSHYLLPFSDYSVLCEALLLLSRLTTGNRLFRYLTLYKAYELITDRPDPSLSAMRHAIAHAGSLLTSPGTIRELNAILGTRFFNPSRRQDRQQLFLRFAQMLMVTDARLARLLQHAKRRIEIQTRDEIVYEFELADYNDIAKHDSSTASNPTPSSAA